MSFAWESDDGPNLKFKKTHKKKNNNNWDSQNTVSSTLPSRESVLESLDSFGHHRGDFCEENRVQKKNQN